MRDPFTSVRVVSLTDPALAFTDSERKAYERTRDPAQVKVKPGHKPAWFTIQRIDALFAMHLLEPLAEANRGLIGFRAGVTEIELPNGEKLTPRLEPAGAYGVRLADEEWVRLAAARVGPRRVAEIGALAARLAQLDEEAFDPLSSAPGPAPTS